MLPQTPDKVNDLISLLLEASNEIVEEKDDKGHIKKMSIPDSESIWMQTKMVNSPTFGRYILKLRTLYDLGMSASDYMCADRASVISKQVLGKYKSHKYSIDAKSSETLRDKHNSQSSLNHIILRQHQERSITVKDMAEGKMKGWIMGKSEQEAAES